jgi:hypothetical protein
MNRFKATVLLGCTASISLMMAGCGDDDDANGNGGINPQTPCEEMVYAICEAACECSEECAWSADAVSSSSSDFETCYNMELAWGTCDEVEMDFEACTASISQDQCVEGSFGLRLELEEPCWDLSGW